VPQAPHPHPPARAVTLRAVKADIVLGAQLVSRHRAPRLAAILVLVLLAAATSQNPAPGPARAPLAVVAAGVLAVVSASRLFAPGGALAAHRAAAAPWWITPVGRLTGALLLVHPLALAGAALLVLPGASLEYLVRVSAGLVLYGTAVAVGTAALTPILGSSPAAVVGLLTAWLGVVPPSGLVALVGEWPAVARPLGWAWNILPLPWRVIRWVGRQGPEDPSVLLAWIAVGLTALAWSAERFFRAETRAVST